MNTTNLLLKCTLIFTLIIGTSAISSAQFLKFGPKAGISSSRVQVDETFSIDGNEVAYESGDAELGFHVGAFARVSIVSFFVQPELLFTSAGGKIEVTENGQTTDVRDLNYNKIDVPIMLGKSFGKFFRVQLGPSFSFLISDDARDVNLRDELSQNYNNATIGYQVGLGFDLSKLSVDLKYEGNLSKFGESVSIAGDSFNTDMRTSQFVLSVGLDLL